MKQMLIDGKPTILYGFVPKERHSKGAPNPQYSQSGKVIGRDGEMYLFEGTFDDYTEKVKFSFVSINDSDWNEKWRAIKRFLLKGNIRVVSYEDDPFYFQYVKKIVLKTPERIAKTAGEFECEFTFSAYEYRNDGQVVHTPGECRYNAYSFCEPKYMIKGNGTCVLTVNGKELSFTVSNYATVDVELKLAYRDNDQPVITKGCNIADLILDEGMNNIQITQGFDLKIIPRWRSI